MKSGIYGVVYTVFMKEADFLCHTTKSTLRFCGSAVARCVPDVSQCIFLLWPFLLISLRFQLSNTYLSPAPVKVSLNAYLE